MKQLHTTKRNFRTDTAAAFAAALLALAAAGSALAEQQVVYLAVQGVVDTREGTRAADETEPILLSARLPGAGNAELVIDGTAYGPVEEIAPDGQIFDRTYEWMRPEDGESETVHVMTLEKGGEVLYTARFGGTLFDQYSANGIWYGWLANWKDYVDEQFQGDYEAAAQGNAANEKPMYEAYVAAMDPTDPDARIRLFMESLEESPEEVLLWVEGSKPTKEIGSRRYIVDATDSLMPDVLGAPPRWVPFCELPGGSNTCPKAEFRADRQFFRARVELP